MTKVTVKLPDRPKAIVTIEIDEDLARRLKQHVNFNSGSCVEVFEELSRALREFDCNNRQP